MIMYWWLCVLLLFLSLVLLRAVIKQFLVHLHEELQSVVYQTVDCPEEEEQTDQSSGQWDGGLLLLLLAADEAACIPLEVDRQAFHRDAFVYTEYKLLSYTFNEELTLNMELAIGSQITPACISLNRT